MGDSGELRIKVPPGAQRAQLPSAKGQLGTTLYQPWKVTVTYTLDKPSHGIQFVQLGPLPGRTDRTEAKMFTKAQTASAGFDTQLSRRQTLGRGFAPASFLAVEKHAAPSSSSGVATSSLRPGAPGRPYSCFTYSARSDPGSWFPCLGPCPVSLFISAPSYLSVAASGVRVSQSPLPPPPRKRQKTHAAAAGSTPHTVHEFRLVTSVEPASIGFVAAPLVLDTLPGERLGFVRHYFFPLTLCSPSSPALEQRNVRLLRRQLHNVLGFKESAEVGEGEGWGVERDRYSGTAPRDSALEVILGVYQDFFGVPYPFESYNQVFLPYLPSRSSSVPFASLSLISSSLLCGHEQNILTLEAWRALAQAVAESWLTCFVLEYVCLEFFTPSAYLANTLPYHRTLSRHTNVHV